MPLFLFGEFMKIKLLVSRGGVGFNQNAGDIIEVDESEGLRMIKKGQAVISKENKKERANKKRVFEQRD